MTGDAPTGGTSTGDVVVLRALGLGDALTGVAALRGVRRAWLRDLGVVDDVLVTDGLAPLAWDRPGHVAVNLHGRGPQSHAVLAATEPERLVAFATPEHPDGPAWRPDEHEVARWCRLVTAAGGPCEATDLRLDVPPDTTTAPGTVVLHPGAASGSRRWPPDRWGAVARALVDAGHDVTLTGGPAERDLCASVAGHADRPVRVLAGVLDVPGLAAVVAGARLVVCGDTGVAHVATAVGAPSVLLFGPTPPRWWGPALDVDRHVVLWHGAPDRPGDPHGATVDPALAAVTVDEVLAAAAPLLAASAAA